MRTKSVDEFNEEAYKDYVNNKLLRYISKLEAVDQGETSKEVNSLTDSTWYAEKMALISKAYEDNFTRVTSKKSANVKTETPPSVHPFVIARKSLNQKLKSSATAALKQSQSSISDTDFENKQGFLKWPLGNSDIVYPYGENKHKASKTTFTNFGVDLSSPDNNLVSCIESGIVAQLININDGTQAIVVKHSPSYISTYSNIKIGNVHAGDNVTAGQVMGICAMSEGEFSLHFQIWKEDKAQNPRHWLKNR